MLQPEAAQSLETTSATVLASAWRSPAEQYLILHWKQHGICGVQNAANPGSSLFETGLAVDFGYQTEILATGWT